jgi:hypothetical protein
MSNRGIQEFYYTRDLPSRAIAIAKITTTPYTPAQLVDISNTVYQPGTLGVWKNTSSLAGAADFIAPDYNQAIAISGTTVYYIDNQYFELTNVISGTTPLFYQHPLPASITDVRILDIDGNVQEDAVFLLQNQYLYHNMDGAAYRVRYVDAQGFLRVQLLQYKQVQAEAPYAPSPNTYVLGGRVLTLVRYRDLLHPVPAAEWLSGPSIPTTPSRTLLGSYACELSFASDRTRVGDGRSSYRSVLTCWRLGYLEHMSTRT